MKKHKWYNEIIAFAEGKDIEYSEDNIIWFSNKFPSFFDEINYRVKLKPKPDVIKFIKVNSSSDMSFTQNNLTDINKWHNHDTLGIFKITIDGKTGKLKSVEIVNDEEN